MSNGIQKCVYLPLELAAEYDELATENDRSFSAQVKRALKAFEGDGRCAPGPKRKGADRAAASVLPGKRKVERSPNGKSMNRQADWPMLGDASYPGFLVQAVRNGDILHEEARVALDAHRAVERSRQGSKSSAPSER